MKYCRLKLLKMAISNPKTLSNTLQNNFSLRILLFDQGFDTNKHKFREGLSKPFHHHYWKRTLWERQADHAGDWRWSPPPVTVSTQNPGFCTHRIWGLQWCSHSPVIFCSNGDNWDSSEKTWANAVFTLSSAALRSLSRVNSPVTE